MSFYGKIYQEAAPVDADSLTSDGQWIQITGNPPTITHTTKLSSATTLQVIGTDGYAYVLTIDTAGHITQITRDTSKKYSISYTASNGSITIN